MLPLLPINFPALLISQNYTLFNLKAELTGSKTEESHEFFEPSQCFYFLLAHRPFQDIRKGFIYRRIVISICVFNQVNHLPFLQKTALVPSTILPIL